ncbi:MAG: hypothetical protein ACRELF_00350, partial [Gemmataceae bacterium]
MLAVLGFADEAAMGPRHGQSKPGEKLGFSHGLYLFPKRITQVNETHTEARAAIADASTQVVGLAEKANQPMAQSRLKAQARP